MNSIRRADPGIYMVCDPRPGCARVTVQAMACAAGAVDDRMVAIEGPRFAVLAASPPVKDPSCGPGLYCDQGGVLIWAGDMSLPSAWHEQTGPTSPQNLASILHHQLVTQGPRALAEIDGSFCGAWFDVGAHTWTVFNDRWGLIPLFWSCHADRFIVAPRARLAWQASERPLSIDANGVADLLRTQNMLDDHTLISGVHWLEPAHSLGWDGRRARTRRYWDFQHRPTETCYYQDVLHGYLDAARPTLARMTGSDAPLIQGLSGGLDSRLFLGLCREHGRLPVCYTSGFAFGEDVRFARQLSRVVGAQHQLLYPSAEALPEQLRASIIDTDGLHGAGHLALSAPIAGHVARNQGAVLLEGYLHGVLGGSDLPADADVPADVPPHRHSWARAFLHGGGGPETIDALLREDVAADSIARWQAHVDDTFGRAAVDDPLCRAEYAIITGRSGRNDVLVPAMYRRHVLARHPACDRQMIEWYATTPARLRRARQVYIDVLRQHFPVLARAPRADGCSGMPLAAGRWRRECAWQREKLYDRWARLRYADVRRWGRDSTAARAWAFETCRQAGMFDPLLAPGARVREWVRPQRMQNAFDTACRDPRQSVPMLSLLTIETMVRGLERVSRLTLMREPSVADDEIGFRRVNIGALESPISAICT